MIMNLFFGGTMRQIILAVTLLVITACGGGGSPQQPKVARVEITSGTALFMASGQSSQFQARAFDGQNKPIETVFTWISSNPTEISLSSTGEAVALVDLGSSAITAQAEGIKSAPIVAVVAKPADGTVLLTDSQILGDIQIVTNDSLNPFNSTLKIKLGATSLTPGTVFISSQSKALAGKVISSVMVSDGTEVTFAPIKLQDAFKDLKLGIQSSAQSLPLDFKNLPKPSRIEHQPNGNLRLEYPTNRLEIRQNLQGRKEFKLGPFDCEITGKASISEGQGLSLEIKPELNLTLDGTVTNAEIKDFIFKLDGKLTGTLFGGITVTSSLDGSVACRAVVFKLRYPVFGPISAIIAPVIPIGLGLELKGKVTGPNMELGVEGKASATLSEGFSYKNGQFADLSNFQIDKSLVPKIKPPSIEDLKLDASAWIHVYSGLWAGICLVIEVETVDALLGMEAVASFAFEKPQAKDADYASNYDIKFKGEIKPGKHLSKFIEYIFGEGSLNISATISEKIKESPTGTATADKSQVNSGEKVKFKVVLDPKNLDFPLIGYNVAKVLFYRIRNDGPAELMATRFAGQGMSNFDYDWIASSKDVGVNDFYVFVVTNGILDAFPLEINKDSKMRVIVTGDDFVTISIAGTKTEDYTQPATGNESSSVKVNWRFDQTDKAPTITAPGLIFGQPIPGNGYYFLKPTLEGAITHKGSFNLEEECFSCVTGAGTAKASRNFDYSASSPEILASFYDYSVFATVNGDGTYNISLGMPDANLTGDYSGSQNQTEGCPTDDPENPPRPASIKNISGSLKQKPLVQFTNNLNGTIDLSTQTLLQGTRTFESTLAVLHKPSGESFTESNNSWDVPVTVTVTWKLTYVIPATESIAVQPYVLPFPTIIPALSLTVPQPTQTLPWEGINRYPRVTPRC
jgi:hypothetical protein